MQEQDRLKTAALATASAMKANINRSAANRETNTSADMEQVNEIIQTWGSFPRKAALNTINKYGPPQEATPSQLIWYNNGPWKRTRILRDEIPHHFPQPHTDVVENWINYRVPPEKLEELARLDGSLIIDRTRGEAASRCDMEAANFIALNLMHDVINGKTSVKKARQLQGEYALGYLMRRPIPYATGLHFEVPRRNSGYKDHSKIGAAMLHQSSKKLKEELWNGNRKIALLPILGFLLLLGLIQKNR